jgi:hypothetical protein
MPSSKEIIHNINRRLRSAPRKTLGVAAASAAVAGVVAGAALSASPASAATSPVAAPGQPAALSTPAATTGANTLDVAATPLLNSVGTGSTAPAAHQASAQDDAATKHTAAAAPSHHAAHRAAVHTVSHHAAPAPPARPYEFYDSVTPSAIPAGHEIATYADGPFAVSPSQVGGQKVLWIDTNGSDPSANVLDVEPGDATPSQAATWAQQKLSADPNATAIVYTMQSEWPATQSAIGTLPSWMQSHVRWWIADPTGYPHMVPGANATQWYWGQNYDISTANPGF